LAACASPGAPTNNKAAAETAARLFKTNLGMFPPLCGSAKAAYSTNGNRFPSLAAKPRGLPIRGLRLRF
jgi:hypothetical protein